ncbi:Uncharacterised protein [Serratia fonticola]|jgi:hypothetical protein|nr:Uncharacterised protein [Serratia fonticola]
MFLVLMVLQFVVAFFAYDYCEKRLDKLNSK